MTHFFPTIALIVYVVYIFPTEAKHKSQLKLNSVPVLKAAQAKLDLSNQPLKENAKANKPLEGGISLSLTLPPIPANLRKGAIFKAENLPKPPKVTDWWLVPAWFAGTWHRETVTEVYMNEFIDNLFGWAKIRTQRADHIWGHQVDRLGGIWHHRVEPYTQIVDLDNYIGVKTVTLQEPVSVSDSKVIVRYKDATINYKKSNNKITYSFRHEQISEITKRGDLMTETIWHKNYDENGNPTDEGHAKSTYTLIKPFEAINSDQKTKLDLQKDFALYLKVHGYSDRIPEALIEYTNKFSINPQSEILAKSKLQLRRRAK